MLKALKINPKLTKNELSEKTGLSVATVKRLIDILKKIGILERVGSYKAGSWIVKQ